MKTWSEFLENEFKCDYFLALKSKLQAEYTHKRIYPPKDKIFEAFKYASYEDLKVVIIGQDPYHQTNQACGLSFSVPEGVKIPKSLANIYKELKNDLGCEIPDSGSLIHWAKQGVLLLNSTLTVEDSKPLSHKDLGWEIFYKHVLEYCNQHPYPLVFILWGQQAQKAQAWITHPQHLILKSAHPSPLSAYHGFFGSKPFSITNAYLVKNHRTAIDWCL